MNEREEWIEERIAIILEGSSFPLGDGRWGQGITEAQARALAETVYDTMFSDDDND